MASLRAHAPGRAHVIIKGIFIIFLGVLKTKSPGNHTSEINAENQEPSQWEAWKPLTCSVWGVPARVQQGPWLF